MTPADLSRTVLHSVRGAVEACELTLAGSALPERVEIAPPPRPGCGDYATNVALRLAGAAGLPPREVAGIVQKRLAAVPGIVRVEVAGPGFLNITLGARSQAALVRDVLAAGAAYGREEQASAVVPGAIELRPAAGPRAAAVADALRAIMEAAGERTAPGGEDVRPVPVKAKDQADPTAAVTYEALLARLGHDDLRWHLLRPRPHDHVRLPERPVQRESNPRFRVQYAYARSRALVRNACDLGFDPVPGDDLGAGDRDMAPLRQAVATYPDALACAARLRAPDRLVRHLEGTADAFFRFHDGCPPLPAGEQKPEAVHRARLALAQAAGTVLANGLTLLGVSAPEHL